jgi:hypothetical protein
VSWRFCFWNLTTSRKTFFSVKQDWITVYIIFFFFLTS